MLRAKDKYTEDKIKNAKDKIKTNEKETNENSTEEIKYIEKTKEKIKLKIKVPKNVDQRYKPKNKYLKENIQ